MYGQMGDDKLYGENGSDIMYGDGKYGQLFGDDMLWGGAGEDYMYGGIGDDTLHGGEDNDLLDGEAGDDLIYGNEGHDTIFSGTGWDTIYGNEGCDMIMVDDGGDVIWLGDCDGTFDQTVTINGTGDNPENYTVIMDFWLTSAMESNFICVGTPQGETNPSAPMCNTSLTDNQNYCLGADEVKDPDVVAISIDGGSSSVSGIGCANDNGPLWVTMTVADDTETVYAVFYQRVPGSTTSLSQTAEQEPLVSEEASNETPEASEEAQ